MSDRPILFSAPMVRALLAGTKTQTRRVLKPQPNGDVIHYGCQAEGGAFWTDQQFESHRLRIWAGDRLWVRESGQLLREAYDHDPVAGEDRWRDAGFYHSADGEIVSARPYDPPLRDWIDECTRISRPSIHMPRWASRLTLTVTDVRVQRLQDISGNDAQAEGILIGGPDVEVYRREAERNHEAARRWNAYRIRQYRDLWDSINGDGDWKANPFVVAYSFTVERRNIDAEG